MGTALTILDRAIGGTDVLVLVVSVVLYFFDDLVEEIVKKLVSVLVHGTAEEFVAFTKLVDEGAGSYGALIHGILGNINIE